jgi:possible anti-sigV factor
MKDWKLIEAMGKIDERYVMEADEEASAEKSEEKKEKVLSMKDKTKRRRLPAFLKTIVAACFIFSVLLPNVSEKSAYALQSIPGLGRYFQLITLRKYSFHDDSHSAEVQTPYLAVGAEEAKSDSAWKEAKSDSAEKINADIAKITDELIQEFKEELTKSEYKNLDVHSEVILNSEEYYVLSLSVLQEEGDSHTLNHYYTVDKHSGELLTLSELFPYTANYKEILTEEVKKQIKEHNRISEDKYFVQDGEDEEGFREVTDEQSFYINADKHLVLVFPEGEIAPMSMGEIQFIMPESIWQDG